jgi:hypothetical protein
MSYAGPVSRGNSARTAARSRPGAPLPPAAKVRLPAPYSRATPDRASAVLVLTAGLLVGIAVGAGAALLYAPADGSDTRRALARKRRRLSRRGHDAWDELRDELRRALRRRRARAQMREQADQARAGGSVS